MKPTKEVKNIGFLESLFNYLGYYKLEAKKARKPRGKNKPKAAPSQPFSEIEQTPAP